MNNLIELAIPHPQLPMESVNAVIAFGESFDVTDPTSAEIATAEYNGLAEQEKALKALHDKVKRPILEAGRAIDDLFRPALESIERAKRMFGGKLGAYVEAQKAKELGEQMKAREVHRQEQERLAHEAAKREEEAAAAAARLREEAKKHEQAGNVTAAGELERRAEHAEMAGQQDAQQLIEQLQLTAPAEVAPADKPRGITTRRIVQIECIDVGDTAVAVVEGKVPVKALEHNVDWLRKHAIAMGDEFYVPGVIARWRTSVAAKGGK